MAPSNPFCPCFSPNSVLFSDLDEAARSEQVRVYIYIYISTYTYNIPAKSRTCVCRLFLYNILELYIKP